jgi:hypothetical protein
VRKEADFRSGKLLGFLAILAGAGLAIGVPWVVLANGAEAGLGAFAITLLCLVGVIGGGGLAFVAAFFSIVIPSKASKDE